MLTAATRNKTTLSTIGSAADIFDCPVLLVTLLCQKWEQSNFWLDSSNIDHFDDIVHPYILIDIIFHSYRW